MNGSSVAWNIDYASRVYGRNGGRLLWVPAYAGYFSSTNLVYPNGTTNAVNTGLLSSLFDSNGNGTLNNTDPAPLFVPSEINFNVTVTNNSARLQWATVANGTNFVYYKTNLLSPAWLPLTNFNTYYYGTNAAYTNAGHYNWFVSPQPYPSPITNVWLYDSLTNGPRYYRVMVLPWLTYPYSY